MKHIDVRVLERIRAVDERTVTKGDELPGSLGLLLLLLQSALQVSFSLRQLQLQPQHLGLLGLGTNRDPWV